MIIDFAVENFRSFEEEQVFSLNVEGSRKYLPENYTEIEDSKFAVLNTAAVWGANASGKSNLLKAFGALSGVVRETGSLEEDQSIAYFQPYKLSKEAMKLPVKFSIEFAVKTGVRYEYNVSFLRDKIVEESLHFYPNKKRALLFERGPEDTWETTKFGTNYKGGTKRIPFFTNNSYLSKAGNDASAPDSVRDAYKYLRTMLVVEAGPSFRITNFFDEAERLDAVASLIALADVGVEKISAIKNDVHEIRLPEEMPEELKEAIRKENATSFKFWMRSKSEELVEFDLEDMSDGTQNLFQMLPVFMIAINAGVPVFIDELEGHLHTNLAETIIRIFNDPVINPKGAQLIFSTHDMNLMNSSYLRRDQIWMVQKDAGASRLFSLDEFDKNLIRTDSPFAVFYKEGRFGALPRLRFGSLKDKLVELIWDDEKTFLGKKDAKIEKEQY